MAQGWQGNSEGHAKAGRLGGLKSAANRRAREAAFGERVAAKGKSEAMSSPDSPPSESKPQTKQSEALTDQARKHPDA